MEVPEVDVDEAARRRDEGVPVLDVRQPAEYDEAHVPGALLVPLADVPDRVAEIPAGDDLLIICRSGNRSRRAAEYLLANGIPATNVAGGMVAWIESGRDVATGSDGG